jgi:hypothetical protein
MAKACGFRMLAPLFLFERKRGKKNQKASPALAAFCAQGSAKFAGDFQKYCKQCKYQSVSHNQRFS